MKMFTCAACGMLRKSFDSLRQILQQIALLDLPDAGMARGRKTVPDQRRFFVIYEPSPVFLA